MKSRRKCNLYAWLVLWQWKRSICCLITIFGGLAIRQTPLVSVGRRWLARGRPVFLFEPTFLPVPGCLRMAFWLGASPRNPLGSLRSGHHMSFFLGGLTPDPP
jgi:hypothetical protein